MTAVGDTGAHRQETMTAVRHPEMAADAHVLDPVVQPQCSLAVQLRRVSGSVVGRPLEPPGA